MFNFARKQKLPKAQILVSVSLKQDIEYKFNITPIAFNFVAVMKASKWIEVKWFIDKSLKKEIEWEIWEHPGW